MRGEIFIVVTDLFVGGTEGHIASIAPLLIDAGWSLTVFSLHGDGPVAEKLRLAGVTVLLPEHPLCKGMAASLFSVPRAAYALFAALRLRKPAIVHFFLPAAYLIGAPVALLAGCRRLIMSRRSLNTYQSAPVRLIERALHRKMKAITGNSQRVVDQLCGERVPEARLLLIYNGSEITRDLRDESRRRAVRATLEITPETLVIVVVANLIPYKGHVHLFSALAQIKAGMPAEWRLLVVGRDDGIGSKLRAQAATAGLDGNIVFLGARDDVAALLNASDIAVLPSHQEGFSNFVLEAMAAHLPLIVTDVGGNSEAVLHNETGLVVPAHDPDALAGAIRTLAADPALRSGMGEAGYQRVVAQFSLEPCVAAYDALYEAVLADRSAD